MLLLYLYGILYKLCKNKTTVWLSYRLFCSHARLNTVLNTVRSWLAQYRTLGQHQEIKNFRPNNGNSLTLFGVVARLEFNSLLIIVFSNDDPLTLGNGTWRFTPVEY